MFGRVVQLLRTMQALMGLPIISCSNGEELGRVVDGLFDGKMVAGLSIKQPKWFTHHMFLPISAILEAGQAAIMVANPSALQRVAEKHKQLYPICTSRRRFKGKPLLSNEGDILGLVEDVYFCVEMGTIIGYEVTDGWLVDLKEGRKIVKGEDLVISKERAILSL